MNLQQFVKREQKRLRRQLGAIGNELRVLGLIERLVRMGPKKYRNKIQVGINRRGQLVQKRHVSRVARAAMSHAAKKRWARIRARKS